MAHPNALPQSKQDYLQTLLLSATGMHLREFGVDAALLFYHGEVPLHRAKDYMTRLTRRGASLRTSPAFEPVVAVLGGCAGPSGLLSNGQDIADLFAFSGATPDEALRAAQVLRTKLPRKLH